VALSNAGVQSSPGNTYLAHFAGPQGAIDVLKSDPSTPVSRILSPDAIKANPFLANMTAGQLQQWAAGKVGAPPEGYYGGRLHVTVPAAQQNTNDPYAQFTSANATPSGVLPLAITDIPQQIGRAFNQNLSTFNQNLNPFSQEWAAAHPDNQQSPLTSLQETGAGLLSIPGMIASPITGTARSVIGHTFDAMSPQFTDAQKKYLADRGVQPVSGQDVADTAMMGMAPARGGLPIVMRPAPVPPAPTGPLGVTLSEGQKTGDLALIRKEQMAKREQLGPAAKNRSEQFAQQQADQVASANERVSRSFDQFGANVAENPQEAGSVAQTAVQNTARNAKAAVSAKYQQARALGGEVDAGHVGSLGTQIRSDLSYRSDPVIVDDKLTPFASRALDEVDNASKFR